MDYFWKQHRTYLIAVGVGLVSVLVYNGCVLSPIKVETEQIAAAREKEEADLKQQMARGVPAKETLTAAESELKRSAERLVDLRKEMSFKVKESFSPPTGETPRTHYDDLKIKLYNELRDASVKNNVLFPKTLGLDPAGVGVRDELAEELLIRLAVVESLVRLTFESGVARIDVIDALYDVDYKDEPVLRKGAFLDKITVFIGFKGPAESGFRVLHGVQKKGGGYLAVSKFRAVRADRTRDLFTFSLVVSLLKIDPKGEIHPKVEKEERW